MLSFLDGIAEPEPCDHLLMRKEAAHMRHDRNLTGKSVTSNLYKEVIQVAVLPDQLDAVVTDTSFQICARRMKETKSDLSHDASVELCRRMMAHADGSRAG